MKSSEKPKKRKLGKRLQELISQLRSGQRLCKSIRLKEGSVSEVTWHFEPSGKPALPATSQKAMREGLIKPAGDGLFGGETSQTWELA